TVDLNECKLKKTAEILAFTIGCVKRKHQNEILGGGSMKGLFKVLFMLGLVSGVKISWAAPQDHCAPYAHDAQVISALELLAELLSYEYHELCELPRLMAIYPTRVNVYNSSKDEYQ